MHLRRIHKLGVGVLGVALLLLAWVSVQTLPNQSNSVFWAYAIGNPDSQGNCICEIHIYQDDGGWQLLLNHTSASNFTVQVTSDMHTRFEAKVRLNKTLADSTQESYDNTRVYLSVSGELSNQLMANVSGTSDANFWYVLYRYDWTQSGKPEYGVDYDVSFDYDAYY